MWTWRISEFISECCSRSSSVVLSHTANNHQSSFSSAGFCLSAASERTKLFMALCISQVVRWMERNAPPATHSQFLLIQLWGFILTRLQGGQPTETLFIHKERNYRRWNYTELLTGHWWASERREVMKASKTILYVAALRMKTANKRFCGPVIRHQNKVYHRHITVINYIVTVQPANSCVFKICCVFSFTCFHNKCQQRLSRTLNVLTATRRLIYSLVHLYRPL